MAFLLYLLQINIALSLLYLCYKVLFSQNTFFGLRRLILISIVLFSTTYPWYDIPDIDPIIPAHLQITLPEVLYSMEETVPQKAFDIYPLIAYLYGGICSLFLLRMFLRIASIIKLRANGKLRIIGESHIIVCDENIQPCSFFRWIFLPHSILQNKNTLTRILRHENTHIRQLHTIDVLLGESMAALCWINPLSWLLLKEIRLNLEYMADEAAIPDEQEKKTYQYLLLDISQSNNELPSAIPFNTVRGENSNERGFPLEPYIHNFCTIYPLSAYEKITLLYRSFSGSIRLEKSCRYSRRNHTIYL